jgi:hypothetical protein
MVYFRELNYLSSSRFFDFIGSFREMKKKEDIIVHNFAIHSLQITEKQNKISYRIYFGWIRRFQGSIRVRLICKKWAAKKK